MNKASSIRIDAPGLEERPLLAMKSVPTKYDPQNERVVALTEYFSERGFEYVSENVDSELGKNTESTYESERVLLNAQGILAVIKWGSHIHSRDSQRVYTLNVSLVSAGENKGLADKIAQSVTDTPIFTSGEYKPMFYKGAFGFELS